MNLKNAKEIELKQGVTRRVTQVSQTLRTPGVRCEKRHLLCLPTWGCYCPQLYWSEFLTHPRRNALVHCEGKDQQVKRNEMHSSYLWFLSPLTTVRPPFLPTSPPSISIIPLLQDLDLPHHPQGGHHVTTIIPLHLATGEAAPRQEPQQDGQAGERPSEQ